MHQDSVNDQSHVSISSQPRSSSKLFLILGVLVLLVLTGVGSYLVGQKNAQPPTNVFPAPSGKACTQEAKLCPDGSSVGRVGPNCEFAACPTSDITANWKTYTDDKYNFTVKYPPTWHQELHTFDGGYGISFADPDPFVNTINISVISNPKKLSALEYFKTEAFKGDLPEWKNDKIPTQKVDLEGIDGVKIDGFMAGSGPKGSTAFISKGTNIIEIGAQNPSEAGTKMFNQMLSTFKFTDGEVMEVMPPGKACDLNSDGKCDSADRLLFQKALGAKRGGLNYNPLADADADGTVTTTDEQMLFSSMVTVTPSR
jgi:hypothetical protein